MKDRNTFRGCMTGGAAGDALGYAVEFTLYDEIISKYGSPGITEYELYRIPGGKLFAGLSRVTGRNRWE